MHVCMPLRLGCVSHQPPPKYLGFGLKPLAKCHGLPLTFLKTSPSSKFVSNISKRIKKYKGKFLPL